MVSTNRHARRCVRSTSKHLLILVVVLVGLLCIFVPPVADAAGENPLLRFPDIHDNTIVFVHGEDIWTVPAGGGVATRLTLHDGEERFPKFSPDGKWIAFTGDYDGNTDVYVMSVHGGDITRVTAWLRRLKFRLPSPSIVRRRPRIVSA